MIFKGKEVKDLVKHSVSNSPNLLPNDHLISLLNPGSTPAPDYTDPLTAD